MSTAVFPTLPGLTWNVVKRPIFSTSVQTTASGRELRTVYYQNPIWEFELSYDLLRSDAAHTELQTLIGFYLARQGSFDSFYFQDPSDYAVTQGIIGTGNGVTTSFRLIRTLGTFSEPVGAWNAAAGAQIFVGGQLQTTGVGIDATSTVNFSVPPPNGALVAATFQFYYVVRFKDDQNDFEEFMANLWQLKKLTLRSVR